MSLDSNRKPPQVSVVIPVHNRPVAVRRAIESVLAQTCQDFEIIVVDDGSTDGTVAAVEAIGDPRIEVIRHERNLGASPARNTGIRAGSAPYVAFLDSDDEWFPTRLEKLLSAFEHSGAGVGFVYTGADRLLADGSVLKRIPTDRGDLERILLTDNVIGGASVAMVRRAVLDEIGAFDENLRCMEDLDLWLRIAERFPIRCIPEALVRISEPTDRPRLSLNIQAVSDGREMFYRKHRAKLVRHRLVHLFLRESGWWQQRYARDLEEARRFYRASIVARPFAPLTYLFLLGACVPLSWQDAAARTKSQSRAWVRSADRRRSRPRKIRAGTFFAVSRMIGTSVTAAQRAGGTGGQPAAKGDRISIFFPTLAGGGAEQVMLTLADGFLRRGHPVDVVVVKAQGELLARIPPRARLIELGAGRVIFSLPALVRYLRRERPMALLSTLHTANAVAVMAGLILRGATRVAIRQADNLSRGLERGRSESIPLLEWLIRWSYRHADAVVAVSTGVADDLAERLRLPRSRIHVVPNPIVTSELRDLASRSLDHEWFATGAPPVVIGIGRLTRQKRFDLLIEAFARVRECRDARLMILGEGEERHRLQTLIRELCLEHSVVLQGFVENPFTYLSRAQVFALSSDWEGLPGALIQALACGTPVIATDCDSGPREILQGGRLGRLVPVGDVGSLAHAIQTALNEPRVSPPFEACLPYTESTGVDAYLRILQPPSDD